MGNNIICLKKQNFCFRHISQGENLPANIRIVDAPDLKQAMLNMFTVAATNPQANFIVWNPAERVLDHDQQEILLHIRKDTPFKLFSACNLRPHAGEQSLSIHTKLDVTEEKKPDIRQKLLRLFQPRLKTLYDAAIQIRDNGQYHIREMEYEVSGGISGLGQTVKFNRHRFHIDLASSSFFRLVHSDIGPGTFVVSNEDCHYSASDELISGRLLAESPIIWMLASGSFALMRQGGKWKEELTSLPALHSIPFENESIRPGEIRAFERCDFRLL